MIRKVKAIIKSIKKRVTHNSNTYALLNKRYKNKIKIEYLSKEPSKANIYALTQNNKFIIYTKNIKSSKELWAHSKYCDFIAYIYKDSIYFSRIENNYLNNKNSLRNIYDIKLFNDFFN